MRRTQIQQFDPLTITAINVVMGSEKKRKRKELSSEEKRQRKQRKSEKIENEEKQSADVNIDKETEAYLSPIAKRTSYIHSFHSVRITLTVDVVLRIVCAALAGRKLSKKLFKLIGAAATGKSLKRGVREVVLGIRKGDNGIVVLAGDVFPIDVIAHVPLLCEESSIPYCYVGRKTELGSAGLTNRPTSVVMISEKKSAGDVKDTLQELRKDVQAIQNLY